MNDAARKYWWSLVLPILVSLGVSAAGGFAWGGRIAGKLESLDQSAKRIEARLDKSDDKNDAIRERLARAEERLSGLDVRMAAIEARR